MRGLVLSGGGANGAFEVGVLGHIIGNLKIHYDVICGVSVGALNGSILAQYPIGEESDAISHLFHVWRSVTCDSDIYRKWFHGILWHLPVLWHKSIYCTKPLSKLVYDNLDANKLRDSGKVFKVGAVCWNTGQYRTWDHRSKFIKEAVLASSAFPLFFEPVQVDGSWYTDGGLRDITPIKEAIDAGCDRIDVIQCGSASLLKCRELPGLLKQAKNAIDILLDEIDTNDYDRAKLVNEMVLDGTDTKHRVIKLHRVRPILPLGDSLDFEDARKWKSIDMGRRMAEAFPDWV